MITYKYPDMMAEMFIIIMEDGKPQLDQISISEAEDPSEESADQAHLSKFHHEYTQYFGGLKNRLLQNWHKASDLKGLFAQNSIVFHPDQFVSPVCRLLTSQHHKKVINAYVKFGLFQLTLQLLFQDEENTRKCQDTSGSFGSVFEMQIFEKTIAVKSIEFTSSQRKLIVISCAIKEYCCLKIASALGFAPRLYNYFGFDLIVFNNCIQFGMQKTSRIRQFDQKGQQQLKEALYALHLLHIVHFDIKPANIAFSNQQKRIVFLDFGLSQTVREKKGRKTLASYRGSLSFCSEEMLHIFYDSCQRHFIDVYYNDQVCLENSIKIMMENLGKQRKIMLNENETITDSSFPKISKTQKYKIALAKFYLCNMKYRQFQQLTKKDLIPYIRNIFHFLTEINSNPILDCFFIEQFKQFKDIEDYVNLQAKFANKSRLWSNQLHYIQNEPQQQNVFSCSGQVIDLSINNDLQKKPQSIEEMHKILQLPQTLHLGEIESYYQMYTMVVRFDTNCHGISLETKLKIASSFRNYALKEVSANQSGLDILRRNFEFIMKYILAPPLNEWKRNSVYMVLRQMIILDCNFQALHQEFNRRINEFYTTMEDHIYHLIEIQKIDRILLLKHLSASPSSLKLLHEYFLSLYQSTYCKILSSKGRQSGIMKKLIRGFASKDPSKENYNTMMNYYRGVLTELPNQTLRMSLQRFAVINELYFRISTGDVNTCFNYLSHMCPYFSSHIFMNNKKYITLDFGLYQLIILMKVINNTSELQRIAMLVKDCFCFQEVYNNFKFDLLIFLSKNTKDVQAYITYAKQIIKSPLPITHQSISAQFILLWKHIGAHPQDYMHEASLISQLLIKIEVFLFRPKMASQLTHQNIINQAFIFQLATQFQPDKHQFVERVLNLLHECLAECKEQAVAQFMRMKCLIYAGSLYMSTNSIERSYQSFKQLLEIAIRITNIRLVNFCNINLFSTARVLGRIEESKTSLRAYFHVCHAIHEFKGYFTHQGADLIHLTLQTIAESTEEKEVYTFMIDLSSFMTLYPLKDYFFFWIESMNKFRSGNLKYFQRKTLQQNITQRSSWQNIYLICYFAISLEMYGSAIKFQVLRQIAHSLRGMKHFARKFVMNIYYREVLQLMKRHQLKVKFIIQQESKRYDIADLGKGIRKRIKEKLSDVYWHRRPTHYLKENCRKVNIF